MFTLTERFKRLGFVVDVPKYKKGERHYFGPVYIKDLSKNTSLIVEGYRKKGYATYRFMFYKSTFIDGGKKIREKVYLENASPLLVLQRVTSFLTYIERSS